MHVLPWATFLRLLEGEIVRVVERHQKHPKVQHQLSLRILASSVGEAAKACSSDIPGVFPTIHLEIMN